MKMSGQLYYQKCFLRTAENEILKNNEHFGTEKPIAYTLFYEKKKRKEN